MTRARDIADVGYKDELVDDTTPQLGGNLDAQSNHITSVGNMGIGTASPTAALHTQVSSGNTIAKFENTVSASGLGEVQFAAPNRPAVRLNFQTSNDTNGFINYDTGAYKIFSDNGSGSAVERMRIDASGRVTMPNQPMFRVGRFTDYQHSGGGYISWNHSHFNVGGHMNTSNTHLFTAPVDGVYWFQATVIIRALSNGANLYDALRFKINGALNGYSSRRGVYNTTSMSHGYLVDEIADAYQLSANDTVGITCEHNVSIHGNNLYTRFNGFLVG